MSSDHLRAITEEVAKHTYPANQPGEEIPERPRYTLQQDGYFKAEVRLARQLVSPIQSTVAVTLEISEGQQYHLKKIAFGGNKVISAQELRQRSQLETVKFSMWRKSAAGWNSFDVFIWPWIYQLRADSQH